MKQKLKRKSFYPTLALAVGLLWSNHSAAALMNSAFEDNLNHWQGDADTIPGTNFIESPSGSATLVTDFDTGGTEFVSFFQSFQVPSNSLSISFDYTSVLDDVNDGWFVQLTDLDGNINPIIFFNGGVGSISNNFLFDISPFSGINNAELLFGLDNIGSGDDRLTIDNIEITQNQVTVPEPSIILLMGVGLLAMKRKLSCTLS